MAQALIDALVAHLQAKGFEARPTTYAGSQLLEAKKGGHTFHWDVLLLSALPAEKALAVVDSLVEGR